MHGRWRLAVLVTVTVACLAGAMRTQAAPENPPRQELFRAIETKLKAAHLPPQDMPKQIIGVKVIGEKRYRVHVAMGDGEGWFEVWWDGSAWQVQGSNAPQ